MLCEILGGRWCHDLDFGGRRRVKFGPIEAHLDGVVFDSEKKVVCAVQIESRNPTQIRGAILDLALHSAPKKLFIWDRKNANNKTVDECRSYCEAIWKRLGPINPGELEIVILDRNGRALVVSALQRLGIGCE